MGAWEFGLHAELDVCLYTDMFMFICCSMYAKLCIRMHICTYKCPECCFGWSAGYSQAFPETPADMSPVLTFPEY